MQQTPIDLARYGLDGRSDFSPTSRAWAPRARRAEARPTRHLYSGRINGLGLVLLSVALVMLPALAQAAGPAALILQTSPVAGFQHHAGPGLFALMAVGDVLTLHREPDNPYDPKAVRVYWKGAQIGYAPRVENVDLARFMDQGQRVEGRIIHLQASRDPWKRVLMEIILVEE